VALRARKLLTLTLTSISKSHPGGILVKLLFSTLIPQCPGALSVRMIAPIYQDMMALMSMRVDCGVVCAKACVCLCVFVFVCVCALIC